MALLADKDIDSDMAKDWADIQERLHVDEPEPVAEIEASTAEVEAETIPVSREADGKFKAQKEQGDDKTARTKDPKAAPATAKGNTNATILEDAAVAAAEPSADQPQTRDVNRAPSTWKPAARAEFDKLSPVIKAEIHRREADFQNGQAQLIPDATLGKNMRQVIEPYRMLIEAEGGTPERAVNDLLRTAAIFRTGSQQQKWQALAGIAQQYGITGPAQPQAPPNGQAAPQQFRDPRVDQMLAHQQKQERDRVQRENDTMSNAVSLWIEERDTTGNPKRPYSNDVVNEMSALIPQIRNSQPHWNNSQILDAAYERAIWANPDVRALLESQRQTELDAQRRADNQTRVRDARRSGSVNVPRRASTPAPGKPGRLEDTIAQTARELGLIT